MHRAHHSIRRLDYRPPAFLVDTVDLLVDLHDDGAEVAAELAVRRSPEAEEGAPLVLDGVDLEVLELAVDGAAVPGEARRWDGEQLFLEVPDTCTVTSRVRIHPETNSSLEGFYRTASGFYLTQCEAEGFRKITPFPDRPDVLARYAVTLEADRGRFPVLLANGNPAGTEDLGNGRHRARWEDPFPKPSYLFAMVAGDLEFVAERFTTRSGREVELRIYTEARNLDRCGHAMASLQKAMRWDEQTFGLECDLDRYNVVVTDDFNMGAMENKGLNVFNSKYVLARPDTATDADHAAIQAVIGHEYFHNWTGNRVTCRDWFQLSLKEGLTVFREQQFSAAMGSPAVQRIGDVRTLRVRQFAEDAGPMAHPVRPDEVVEINNFYTATVYEKGAEVVRMLHTLLGPRGFRRGMDLYLRRHDGKAVTCDDFVRAMADANERDLGGFLRWYSQAGTPVVHASGRYEAGTGTYELTLRQSCPPTPGQPRKEPMLVPVAVGLLDPAGNAIPLRLEGELAPVGTHRVLELDGEERTFPFVDVPAAPVPSLLREYSAPVKLVADQTRAELEHLLAHDPDPFNRWDAGQRLATELLLEGIDQGGAEGPPPELVRAFGVVLGDGELDPALRAEALVLPSESYLGDQLEIVDVDTVHAVREQVRRGLGRELREEFAAAWRDNEVPGPYRFTAADAARRRLRNVALGYLAVAGDEEAAGWCEQQARGGANMTEVLGALAVMVMAGHPGAGAAMQAFYDRWQDDPNVVDKWLALQAQAPRPDILARVRELMDHPAFSMRNPNKVRALIGAFTHNLVCFHHRDGSGYRFVADRVLELDRLNPQVAARLVSVFNPWRRHVPERQELMKAELQRIAAAGDLSRDVAEIVGKALT